MTAEQKWKLEHKEHIKEYRAKYYKEHGNHKVQEPTYKRKCTCGLLAMTDEDLSLFVKDPRSKHGRRNKCKECASTALPTEVTRTCKECGEATVGELEIEKKYRRTNPSRNNVIGALVKTCKKCEFPEDSFYLIDGRYIPKSP